MRNAIIAVLLTLVFLLQLGQATQAQPSQNPVTQRQEQAQLERRLMYLKNLEIITEHANEREQLRHKVQSLPELDRETKDRVRQLRLLDPADMETYRLFLKADRTGIFKIFPNGGCQSKDVEIS